MYPPLLFQERASRETPPPHPIFATHAFPRRLLAWKGLVNYVKGQEPNITPHASQENTLLPRLWPHPTGSDTPGT